MILLPWPPTVNHYYGVARGRKFLSERGRKYKKDCHWIMAGQKVPRFSSGKFSVTIRAFPPDRRMRDLDNLLKPVLDALTEYSAITDDSDVDEIHIIRMGRLEDGSLEIDIERRIE